MSRINKLAVLLLLPIAAGAEPAVPYGTYIVKGSFRGDYNTALRDFGDATVSAKRADGTAIASSSVSDADAEGVNFVLQIPVSSSSTAKACKVGETLDCVFTTTDETLGLPNSLKVGSPVSVGKLTLNCTEVRAYTNAADGAVVEIPASYIQEAQAYLDDLMPGETYNPWADYDHDGISNYSEYLAGTIPFDESDLLRVKEFGLKDGKFALKFEHVGGHVYAVSSADTLARPGWAKRRVRKAAQGAELEQVLADGGEGEPGETVIYITPAAGATSEFFKLEAK